MKELVVAVADLHSNSVVGLFPPEVELSGLGSPLTVLASKAQRTAWRYYCEFWSLMAEKKKRHKARCTSVFVGDLLEANARAPIKMASHNLADVVAFGAQVLEPALAVSDRRFVVRGTNVHGGGHGALEELLAQDIGAVRDEEARQWSWWWLTAEIGGVHFKFQHHPMAKSWMPWLMDQSAARESAIVAARCMRQHTPIPDWAVYGHVHYPADSGIMCHPHVVYLPAWTGLPTVWEHERGISDIVRPYGGAWWLIEDGKVLEFDMETYWPRRKKEWKDQSI